MKTPKDRVLEALISNLKVLRRDEEWYLQHPLVTFYTRAMDENHRIHHDWVHIDIMLKELDSMGTLVRQPLRTRAAIIFHDVVCTPGAKNNEENSAVFASKFYRGNHLSVIHDFIMATEHKFPFEHFGDDRDIICDLDLMTLGAFCAEFDQYRLNIAMEYRGFCTPEEFDASTIEFFKKLQDQAKRDYIYRTKRFRSRYEERARENIKRVLGL